jgi:hypothetical protein
MTFEIPTFLLLLSLVAPEAPPASAPAPALTQAEAESATAEVLPQIESIRGLTFKTKVPVRVIDDAKARAYALARFKRMTPDSKIAADQAAYRLLGLVPRDTDVLKTLLDVLEEQAGGFYDPQTKSFYLLDDQPRDMTALLAAHEMTHALEDQYYDIDGRLARIADDDDASFALSAVAEGSASVAMTAYVTRRLADTTLRAEDLQAIQRSETGRAKRLDAMPGVLRKELLGPYVLGSLFLERGNAAAMSQGYPKADADAAWKSPPRSSEQILHPEKYWDPARRDEPKRVVVPDASTILGEGWSRAGTGVLGEIAIGGLVGAPAPRSDDPGAMTSAGGWTNAAAAGWGGDRWELWTNGSRAVVLLVTVWDSRDDALEFVGALPEARASLASRRTGTRVAIVAGTAGDRTAALLDLLVPPERAP